MLVCSFIGLLVYWSIGLSVCQSVGLSVGKAVVRCNSLSFCWSVGLLVFTFLDIQTYWYVVFTFICTMTNWLNDLVLLEVLTSVFFKASFLDHIRVSLTLCTALCECRLYFACCTGDHTNNRRVSATQTMQLSSLGRMSINVDKRGIDKVF